MKRLNPIDSLTFLTGILFFTILLVFSLIFYKERILCFDPAFFLFKMIHFGDFSIEIGRWGSLPSQLLPLLAIKNNYPLESIIKIYSASFILLYIIIFFIITVFLKNYKSAIALMLMLCIGFRHAFYYATAELYQGLALSVLFWALISQEKKLNIILKYILSIFLIIWISFYHQLTLFAILFVLLIEAIDNKRFKDLEIITMLLATVLWFFIRIFLFESSDYEQNRILAVYKLMDYLPLLYHLPSTQYFLIFLKDHFLSIGLTLATTIFLLFYNKKFILFIASGVYGFLFLVLILITFYQGESPVMYENYYTLFGFFIAILLAQLLFAHYRWQIIFAVSVPILIVNTIGIYNGHYTFTKRISYLERLIHNVKDMEERKFILHHNNYPWIYTWVAWGIPFETLILSSIKSPDSSVTFILTDDINKYDEIYRNENIFLGPDWAPRWFSSDGLNTNYFRLPSTGYKKINTPSEDGFFIENTFNSENISISVAQEEFISDADTFIVVPLTITNNSGLKIPSLPTQPFPLFLSYHLYDEQGNSIMEYKSRSMLEMDLEKTLSQGLLINIPKKKGTYWIEADILNENLRWWGINKKFKILN